MKAMTRIENDKQYEAAMTRIEELLKVVNDDTPEDDINSVELVLLSGLVADYEDLKYPIDRPTLPEVLKLRMFEMGLTQSELAAMLDMNQSKISEILAGKSEPTLRQARRMAQSLSISPAILIGL